MATFREVTKPNPACPADREQRIRTGRLEAMVYLGRDPQTKKARMMSKTFANRKEAEAWARKMEGKKDDGVMGPKLSKATLATYIRDTWLPMYRTQVRSSYNLEKVLGKWVLQSQRDMPLLGTKRMRDLTVEDFEQFYAAMAERGLRRGVSYVHGLLKSVFKDALRTGAVASNPVVAARLAKPNVDAEITSAAEEDDDGKVRSLSAEQETRFLAAADQDRLHALWRLLLDAGLRPGEAFALQWRHIDWDAKEVRVRGTLTRVRNTERKARGRGWKITKPKTKLSRREVPVSDLTLAHLRQWKKEQIAERLQLGPEWREGAHDHNFVFTTPLGSPLGNNLGRTWTRLLRAADQKQGDLGTWGEAAPKPARRPGPPAEPPFTPRYSLYILRHTSATLLLEAGENLLTVSRRLGHSDMAFTARTYGHLKAKHTTSAAEAVARRWASSNK